MHRCNTTLVFSIVFFSMLLSPLHLKIAFSAPPSGTAEELEKVKEASPKQEEQDAGSGPRAGEGTTVDGELDNLSITPVEAGDEKLQKQKNEVFYRTKFNELTMYGGPFFFDFLQSPSFLVALSYRHYSPFWKFTEFSFGITWRQIAYFSADFKLDFLENRRFRPYLMFGPTLMIEPGLHLNSILVLANWSVDLTGGLYLQVSDGFAFRAEIREMASLRLKLRTRISIGGTYFF